MLFLFTVAFIVTLIAAVYMQFGSQAERYVMQYKLDSDAVFLFGSVLMFAFSLFSLRDSGVSLNLGITILFFSWMPCGFIAVKVEQIQRSFDELYELGKMLDSKRTKNQREHNAFLFFMEIDRINNGQKNRVHRAILAHKRYYN